VPTRPGGLALVEALIAWANTNPEAVARLRDRQDEAWDRASQIRESR